jgi:hypothetical protein
VKIEIGEAEADQILEALHEMLRVKTEALAAISSEAAHMAGKARPFTPEDFGIPALQAIVLKLDDALLDVGGADDECHGFIVAVLHDAALTKKGGA